MENAASIMNGSSSSSNNNNHTSRSLLLSSLNCKGFKQLLDTQSLVDCTLACEGGKISAHKIVLSACSSYLAKILLEHPVEHPIIILPELSIEEVRTLIHYMYTGELLKSNTLNSTSLLRTAAILSVNSLNDLMSSSHQQQQQPALLATGGSPLDQLISSSASPLTAGGLVFGPRLPLNNSSQQQQQQQQFNFGLTSTTANNFVNLLSQFHNRSLINNNNNSTTTTNLNASNNSSLSSASSSSSSTSGLSDMSTSRSSSLIGTPSGNTTTTSNNNNNSQQQQTNSSSLINHQLNFVNNSHNKSSNEFQFKCPVCHNDFQTICSFEYHMQRIHNVTSFGCQICQKPFASLRYVLTDHMRRCHGINKPTGHHQEQTTAKAKLQHC